MAFGFPAYHTKRYTFSDPRRNPREQVVEATAALGWSIKSESENVIRVAVGFNLWSSGERVTIVFDTPNAVTVTSKCLMPTQCFDWGKNKSNVQALLARLEKSSSSTNDESW